MCQPPCSERRQSSCDKAVPTGERTTPPWLRDASVPNTSGQGAARRSVIAVKARKVQASNSSRTAMKILVRPLSSGMVRCARTDRWATHSVQPGRGARETPRSPGDPPSPAGTPDTPGRAGGKAGGAGESDAPGDQRPRPAGGRTGPPRRRPDEAARARATLRSRWPAAWPRGSLGSTGRYLLPRLGPGRQGERRRRKATESPNPRMGTDAACENLPPQNQSLGMMKILVRPLSSGMARCARADRWATHSAQPGRGARETPRSPRDPMLGFSATRTPTPLLTTRAQQH